DETAAIERHRHDHLGLHGDDPEALRHHADDPERCGIVPQGPADDRRVAAEPPLPVAPPEDDVVGRPAVEVVVTIDKAPPEHRLHAQRFEHSAAGTDRTNLL